LVAVSHTVCVHVGGLKFWGSRSPAPLGRGGVVDPWKKPLLHVLPRRMRSF